MIRDNVGLPGSLVGQGTTGIKLGVTLAYWAYNSHALRFGGPWLSGWDALVTSHPLHAGLGAAKLPSVGMGLRQTVEPRAESSFTPSPQGTFVIDERLTHGCI